MKEKSIVGIAWPGGAPVAPRAAGSAATPAPVARAVGVAETTTWAVRVQLGQTRQTMAGFDVTNRAPAMRDAEAGLMFNDTSCPRQQERHDVRGR